MLHGGTILDDNLQNITGSIYNKSLYVQDLIKRTLFNAYSSVIFTNLYQGGPIRLLKVDHSPSS